MLKRHLMPETLSKLLKNELMPAPEPETEARKDPPWFLRRIRQQKGGDEDE